MDTPRSAEFERALMENHSFGDTIATCMQQLPVLLTAKEASWERYVLTTGKADLAQYTEDNMRYQRTLDALDEARRLYNANAELVLLEHAASVKAEGRPCDWETLSAWLAELCPELEPARFACLVSAGLEKMGDDDPVVLKLLIH